MFEKDDDEFINENILYKSQPNLIFSIKKAIIMFIILWIIFTYSGTLKKSIQKLSDPQQSNIMLTKLLQPIHINETVSIILLFLILILIIWIAWILIKWIKTEYILTDSKIILKRGVINSQTDYMNYNHIQDLRLSQGIMGKIFSVGTVEIYNGYSKEGLKFVNMNTPKKVQKIIFSEMNHDYSFNRNNQINRTPYNQQRSNTDQENHHSQESSNYPFQQNPKQREYDPDNTMRYMNRENTFKQNKFFNNKNNYSTKRNSPKFNHEKQDHDKKKTENDENLSVLERHSKKFRK